MKRILPLLLMALALAGVPSCAVTRPVGTAVADSAGVISSAAVKPMEKLQASRLAVPVKMVLWLPAYVTGVAGTAIALPVFFVGVLLNPHYLD